MLARRSFGALAEPCFRRVPAPQRWVAGVTQVSSYERRSKTRKANGYTKQVQSRFYSVPYGEKVAKFKGEKGSNVRDAQDKDLNG